MDVYQIKEATPLFEGENTTLIISEGVVYTDDTTRLTPDAVTPDGTAWVMLTPVESPCWRALTAAVTGRGRKGKVRRKDRQHQMAAVKAALAPRLRQWRIRGVVPEAQQLDWYTSRPPVGVWTDEDLANICQTRFGMDPEWVISDLKASTTRLRVVEEAIRSPRSERAQLIAGDPTGRQRKIVAQDLAAELTPPDAVWALYRAARLGDAPKRALTVRALLYGKGLAEAIRKATDQEIARARDLHAEDPQAPDGLLEWLQGAFTEDLVTSETSISNICQAAERAGRMRAERRRREALESIPENEWDRTVPAPPEIKQLEALLDSRFERLDTPERVAQEGADMMHCAGSYAGAVHRGETTLFHFEGEHGDATLEVKEGRLIQCFGPGDQNTAASKKAESLMKEALAEL